jgi:hypothetical protein
MAEETKPITFGDKLTPEEEAAYRARIEQSKKGGGVNSLKKKEPVGSIPRPAIPLMQRGAPQVEAKGLTTEGGVAPRPPGSPLLSSDTAQQIQDMAAAQVAEQSAEKKVEAAEAKKEEDIFEMFDFEGRNESERILNNKKRRKDIEARCEEMNIEDLLLNDEVQQLVPIIPDKYSVRFRSMTPEESLFIKQYLAKDQSGQQNNDNYMLEKFSLCQLACSLVSINGKPLPDHRGKDGSPDDDAFKIKLTMLMKKSGYLVADLAVNYMWFDLRVRRLLNPEKLGNG